MVYLPQSTSIGSVLLTKVHTYSDFLSFYPVSLLCSKNSSRIHITFSHLVFLFLITLAVRNTDQIFCRMSLNWDLPVVFLMISLGYEFGEARPQTNMPFSSYHIKCTYYQCDLPLLLLILINWQR